MNPLEWTWTHWFSFCAGGVSCVCLLMVFALCMASRRREEAATEAVEEKMIAPTRPHVQSPLIQRREVLAPRQSHLVCDRTFTQAPK